LDGGFNTYLHDAVELHWITPALTGEQNPPFVKTQKSVDSFKDAQIYPKEPVFHASRKPVIKEMSTKGHPQDRNRNSSGIDLRGRPYSVTVRSHASQRSSQAGSADN
jgi:hypothetical protein